MVKKKLVERLISEGAELLRQLDGKSFPVESMFWFHFSDEDYWRLLIASPIVKQKGGAEGYRRLNELLRSMELAGITLEDISLLDPESAQFLSLRFLASHSSRLATGPEWVELEDAIVYRWTGESLSADLTCNVSAEELTRFWESARKVSNEPKLLIALNDGRVTLRFHPQHGELTGIENVKRPFQLALH